MTKQNCKITTVRPLARTDESARLIVQHPMLAKASAGLLFGVKLLKNSLRFVKSNTPHLALATMLGEVFNRVKPLTKTTKFATLKACHPAWSCALRGFRFKGVF